MKQSKLLHLQEVFFSLAITDEAVDAKEPYEEAIKRMDAHFMPSRRSALERHIFLTLKPEEGEEFQKFGTKE